MSAHTPTAIHHVVSAQNERSSNGYLMAAYALVAGALVLSVYVNIWVILVVAGLVKP